MEEITGASTIYTRLLIGRHAQHSRWFLMWVSYRHAFCSLRCVLLLRFTNHLNLFISIIHSEKLFQFEFFGHINRSRFLMIICLIMSLLMNCCQCQVKTMLCKQTLLLYDNIVTVAFLLFHNFLFEWNQLFVISKKKGAFFLDASVLFPIYCLFLNWYFENCFVIQQSSSEEHKKNVL